MMASRKGPQKQCQEESFALLPSEKFMELCFEVCLVLSNPGPTSMSLVESWL